MDLVWRLGDSRWKPFPSYHEGSRVEFRVKLHGSLLSPQLTLIPEARFLVLLLNLQVSPEFTVISVDQF